MLNRWKRTPTSRLQLGWRDAAPGLGHVHVDIQGPWGIHLLFADFGPHVGQHTVSFLCCKLPTYLWTIGGAFRCPVPTWISSKGLWIFASAMSRASVLEYFFCTTPSKQRIRQGGLLYPAFKPKFDWILSLLYSPVKFLARPCFLSNFQYGILIILSLNKIAANYEDIWTCGPRQRAVHIFNYEQVSSKCIVWEGRRSINLCWLVWIAYVGVWIFYATFEDITHITDFCWF